MVHVKLILRRIGLLVALSQIFVVLSAPIPEHSIAPPQFRSDAAVRFLPRAPPRKQGSKPRPATGQAPTATSTILAIPPHQTRLPTLASNGPEVAAVSSVKGKQIRPNRDQKQFLDSHNRDEKETAQYFNNLAKYTDGRNARLHAEDAKGNVWQTEKSPKDGSRVDLQKIHGDERNVQAQTNTKGRAQSKTFATCIVHNNCAHGEQLAEGLKLSGDSGQIVHLYPNGTPGGSPRPSK